MEQRFKWKIQRCDKDKAEELAKEYRLPHIIANIAIKRGFNTCDKIINFFYPQISSFYSPLLLKDCERAVDRVIDGINRKENFMIFGDYDVDGITATALLLKFLKRFDLNPLFYIPDRHKEGYGLKNYLIEKAHRDEISILISVDTGTSSIIEVERAKELGIDVIIIDHHEPSNSNELPPAHSIINPKRKDCSYPFKNLAGVGVVMKFIIAVSDRLGLDNDEIFKEILDLAALGTIADMVELVDENRLIVKKGLQYFRNTMNIGLCSLCEVLGLNMERGLSMSDISFQIAPRLNAASRVWDSGKGLELLLTDDSEKAQSLARELHSKNNLRLKIEREIVKSAISQIEDGYDISDNHIIILWNEKWDVGVIGIVASKLMDKYKKPVILVGSTMRKNGHGHEELIYQGSMRSFGELSAMELLTKCGEFLISYGAHKHAGGFTLSRENTENFCSHAKQAAKDLLKEKELNNHLLIDGELELTEINEELIEYLEKFAPHGYGNPEPLFFTKNVHVLSARNVGKDGKYLSLKVSQGNSIYDAIVFDFADDLKADDLYRNNIDLVYILKKNIYLGREKIQIQIKDMRTSK